MLDPTREGPTGHNLLDPVDSTKNSAFISDVMVNSSFDVCDHSFVQDGQNILRHTVPTAELTFRIDQGYI